MKKIFYVVFVGLLLAGCGSRNSTSQSTQGPSGASTNEARDYFQEGQALLVKSDMQGAVKIFQEGLAKDPNNSKLHFVMGQVFMRGGTYDNAEKSFKAAIQADPENGNAYLLLGGCYDLAGKKEDAITSVKKSVELFEKQRDATNFRQALAILRKMMGATTAKPQ